MMYNQKMVASIKSKGQILREFKDTVYIKFGSEYSLVLKNLNTMRALVNINIDSTDVCPGGLAVDAGRTVDIERWIKNGNMSEGNRFKFIERTSNIEKHRGIGLEDGLIRIEYQFEKFIPTNAYDWYKQNQQGPVIGPNQYSTIRNTFYQAGDPRRIKGTTGMDDFQNIARGASLSSVTQDWNSVGAKSLNDVGITVPGSKSNQQFVTVKDFPLEPEKHAIVLKLLGETADNRPVVETVTVKHKPHCITCGKQNKATNSFCSHCGTALEIFA